MKKYLIFLTFLFIQNVKSQNAEQSNPIHQKVYEYEDIQVKPKFPGGMEKFYKFIEANYKKPDEAKDVSGPVSVIFIVDINGFITYIELRKDIGYKTGKELIRTINNSPRWLPGEQDGYHVKTKIKFTFNVK
ncbi:MAG TPA: energy transducer TonB [Flavobacterium sp.]|uniref:energy transducer TonB n=1 Tax=Flavobacterium sp. TaxID=239 RepID=UPI002DB8D987|nr:energy transducer TonB [Flavobacterium sp.]HEU4790161.1 energy transducer TonB [Flavobacterium sp.]